MSTLEIKDLHVSVDTEEGAKEILRGVTLTIRSGETHAIMGPNGSGKSTLAYSIAGHPKYTVTSGSVTLDGEDVLAMKVDERARAGVFLAMQYPVEVPGVTVSNFLRTAKTAIDGEAPKLRTWVKDMKDAMGQLRMDPAFAERNVNEGFSGGEKKRHEILQMELLRPSSPCSTRPTPGSTSTRCASSPRASTAPRSPPAPACCSSRTTRASCATSSPTSCTSSSTAGSPRRAARSSPTASSPRATTASSTETVEA